MGPFIRSTPSEGSTCVERFMARFKVSFEEATRMAIQARSEELYLNETYQVSKSLPHLTRVPGWPEVIHLSIIPRDGMPRHSWPDFQEIKNQLCGEDSEAIEIYPKESRLVDMGPNYHLWVFPTGFRIPMGWTQRMVQGE